MTRVAPSRRASEERRAASFRIADRRVAFLSESPASDYGQRTARLRWLRASGALADAQDWRPREPAAPRLAAAEEWVVVADAAAIPLGTIPPAPPGEILRCRTGSLPPVHTVRELEAARVHAFDGAPAAVAFRSDDARPLAGGGPGAAGAAVAPCSAAELFALLASRGRPAEGFVAVTVPDASDSPRPELARRIPDSAVRILDVGCGSAGALTGVVRRAERRITGIERDARQAAAARRRCDRVVEGDLRDALPRLAGDGERFDVVVLADVLEHLEEPIETLAAARRVAARGGTLLVSVPNVGHLSLVRDLLLGRFDPAPSGLCDAGHLRWFSRGFLEEAILEAGWSAPRIERERGAPAPDPAAFLELALGGPDTDRESLETYQWIATALNP